MHVCVFFVKGILAITKRAGGVIYTYAYIQHPRKPNGMGALLRLKSKYFLIVEDKLPQQCNLFIYVVVYDILDTQRATCNMSIVLFIA